jgi:hypothetical protein
MTREQIEQLPAGPEMDAAVAQAMGWTGPSIPMTEFAGNLFAMPTPMFSTEIASAFNVIQFVISIRGLWSFNWQSGILDDLTEMAWLVEERRTRTFAADKSLPLAICRAFLMSHHAPRRVKGVTL